MTHDPGARNVIAHALSGVTQPRDCYYKQADQILECLTATGLHVVHDPEAE